MKNLKLKYRRDVLKGTVAIADMQTGVIKTLMVGYIVAEAMAAITIQVIEMDASILRNRRKNCCI